MTTTTRPTYGELLQANNTMRTSGEETYYLGITRTVQESKFFPVSAYVMLGYLNAFYRYPTLLRKIEAQMSPEDIADRVRNTNSKLKSMGTNWCMPNFYLLGREMLINMGVIRPQDAAEDVVYVLDFWRRYQLAWRRDDAHVTNLEGGHRSQVFPERRIQVMHADAFRCAEGDPLHEATINFTAAVSQYAVLIACESRVCMTNHGPYKIADDEEMLVREFFDLGEGDLPWLDGIAADLPFSRLTLTTSIKDTHFYIVDDWGSYESRPEYKAENLCAVGLYTSDDLSETHTPVGMGSPEELTATLNRYADMLKETTTKLWERFASYGREQLMDAGAMTYFAIIRDFAHVAGVYEHEDWFTIDERADRFRRLLNDEYGNEILGALFVPLSLNSHQWHEYQMMRHSDLPKRTYSPLPYTLLTDDDGDVVTSVGDTLGRGITYLPPKEDRYWTTRGVMTAAELNTATREFRPRLFSTEFRYLDDAWVKYNYDTELADSLYRVDQEQSRLLAGKGAGLRRDDVERLRTS
ncbi:hypothetical protein Acsp06_64300 [Actinomycetospora sp. NBRC 106375]|uniref:hypothetical protein n=1 Tax=Actinomycetospora sp. NBRC 106375 TaxID=3032207 RepID=UPI0024A41FD6|nr:hypothetical protein [Actinomycetospora sp. NBRC 106375]GLZ50245.1 hypothetical protein Acsp06_64300 [Actinomycetospora sp. NBRC 106375]